MDSKRNARGRFEPGCSGNPAGKKPGTRNHATRLKDRLTDDDKLEFDALLLEKASEGNMTAFRMLYDRIDPKPRGPAITVEFPEGATLVEKFEALTADIAASHVSPDDGLQFARVLALQATVAAACARADRVDDPMVHEVALTMVRGVEEAAAKAKAAGLLKPSERGPAPSPRPALPPAGRASSSRRRRVDRRRARPAGRHGCDAGAAGTGRRRTAAGSRAGARGPAFHLQNAGGRGVRRQ